jgi:benzil reductase ((S)-benzoin forming)
MKTVFIITGTTRGLGESLLEKLMMLYPEAWFIAINRSIMSDTSDTRLRSVLCDLAVELDLNAIFGNVSNELKEARDIIFINNAAVIEPILPAYQVDPHSIQKSFNVNCASPIAISNFLVSNHSDKNLTLVNISTGAALRPIYAWSLYCSTKAYTRMFLDVLKLENAHLQLIHFDPGTMDTQMQRSIRDAAKKYEALRPFEEIFQKNKLKSVSDAANELVNLLSQ